MTPKEKAKELYQKYSKGKDENGWYLCEFDSCAKKCALIAVDEIIKNDKENYGINGFVFEYWQEVKQEIENL
jgi:hypothetical protein